MVEWADAEAASGCADPMAHSAYRKVIRMNQRVARAKDSFLARWNAIDARFDTPHFSRSEI